MAIHFIIKKYNTVINPQAYRMMHVCEGLNTPAYAQGFSRNKIEGGGRGSTIGPIETAENADTCVAIIASYILYAGMCMCAQWTASVSCV